MTAVAYIQFKVTLTQPKQLLCVYVCDLSVYLSGARCVDFNIQTYRICEGACPDNLLSLSLCFHVQMCTCVSGTIKPQSIPASQELVFAPGSPVVKQ